ncbi:MAG: triple tyrosine motif-containing protein [Ginsengibacter sp.]
MRIAWILLIQFFVGITCHGQNTIGLPRIINYSTEDFKAANQSWDIQQDDHGIMYFANNSGLLSFDGNHWRLYPLPNKTIVRSIYIGPDHKIYVGGQGEFGYFEPDINGSLKYISLKKLVPKTYSQFADIWDIEPMGESLFFRTNDKIFELNNQNIRVFPSDSEWRYLKRVNGKLIAQDKERGLLEFKNQAWQPLCKEPFNLNLVSGMIPLGQDSVLISTFKDGLFILVNDSAYPKKTSIDENLKKSLVYTMAKINQDEFAIGTTSDGVIILNNEGNMIQKISRTEELQTSNVLCLYLDHDQNLWTGLNRGISFIAYNSAIKYIRPNKTNDLSGYTTVIFNDSLYIATSDGAYVAPVSKQHKDLSFSKTDFTRIKNSSGQVWSIDVINQQLLMGYNDGAFTIRGQTAYPIIQGDGYWLFKPTSAVLPSKEILAGTYTGLTSLNFSNNTFTSNGKIKGSNESLRFLVIDNNNDIWSSHPYRGVFRIRLLPGQNNSEAELLTSKDGLPSDLGNYVFKIKNRIVFATEKGVYEYDRATKRFVPSEFLTPIFKTMEIRYLKEDEEGNIWFCTNNKVGFVNFISKNGQSTFNLTYLPELTGQTLAGSENIYPFNKQNIFIGSENGIIHINYEKYRSKKPELNAYLSNVKAIGKEDSTIFGGYLPLGQKTFKKSSANLPAEYNSFHFEYSSPAYGLQKNIEYSYQLKGYDMEWSEWSAKTEKDYTNLPAGKYTFQLKAQDNLGNESAIDSYSFSVLPPWYQTTWAKIISLLLISFLLYLFYKIQQKKFERQLIKFEEEQRRLKELHQLKVEKNEKEIIKLQNEKLANEVRFKNRELADANLHLVERADALTRVKDELQHLYKKTNNNHDVKKTLQLVNDIEKNNANWEQFVSHFDEVNNDFLKKLKAKFPKLSKTDLKVCAYLQLNLSSKEIAQLMNISVRGVEIGRYRLRKKLNLETEQNLNDFLSGVT